MDRRTKATVNREKALQLNTAWGVGAAQARYSDDGHWYALVERFPAVLFDASGYVLYQTEAEYRSAPELRIVGEETPDDDARAYLRLLRDRFMLPVWYRQIAGAPPVLGPKV